MRLMPETLGAKIRVAVLMAVGGGLLLWFWIIPVSVWAAYTPKEGDVLFQSLPGGNDLVEAIEGATHSPFSHCGMVEKVDGEWMVIEAIGMVHRTPLFWWIWRGRGSRVAAYRLRPEFQMAIPAMRERMEMLKGRPYDFHYAFNNGEIYCSELVFEGYKTATGKELGHVVQLGDLDWQPYRETIMKYDECTADSLPLQRRMITPRDLAAAPELQRVFSYGF
jgi:hypothetical protein